MVTDDVRERVLSYIRHNAAKSPAAVATLVAANQQQLLALVQGVGEEQATRRPAEGEWCVRELVRHVIASQSRVADLVSRLAQGRQPEGRGGIGMMNEDDGRPYAGLVEELRVANARMLESIGGLTAAADLSAVARHPFFGDLNCREWAVFQRVHDADHIQHVRKILDVVAPPPAEP